MAQLGFFDADKRLEVLSAKGDPLEAIDPSRTVGGLSHRDRSGGSSHRISAVANGICRTPGASAVPRPASLKLQSPAAPCDAGLESGSPSSRRAFFQNCVSL